MQSLGFLYKRSHHVRKLFCLFPLCWYLSWLLPAFIMGKQKHRKLSTEHKSSAARFDDPFTRQTTFKATSSSHLSALPQTTAHNINIGRNTLPKCVQVQPPVLSETQQSAASAPDSEKDKNLKPVCIFWSWLLSFYTIWRWKQTQSSLLLDDFEDKLEILLDFVLDTEADDHVDGSRATVVKANGPLFPALIVNNLRALPCLGLCITQGKSMTRL